MAQRLPRVEPKPEPDWQSPHVPQPADKIAKPRKLTILEQAQALTGIGTPPEIVAAIITAQALDRLGASVFEAACVSRSRGT